MNQNVNGGGADGGRGGGRGRDEEEGMLDDRGAASVAMEDFDEGMENGVGSATASQGR